jgi:hypothetical protein
MWTQRSPVGTSRANLASVAYGNGIYVAVGSPDTAMTSSDGVAWTEHALAKNTGLCRVAYGNGLFVAVSTTGIISTSPDGIAWTERWNQLGSAFSGVAFGKNLFVVVGLSGVLTSIDGLSWTHQTSASGLSSVVYANGQFVAVGNSSPPNALVMRSSDGRAWDGEGWAGVQPLVDIAYGNDRFVAVGNGGEVVNSTDAITWTNVQLKAVQSWAIAYGNNQFAIASDMGKVMTSSDGLQWTDHSVSTNWLRGIAYVNNQFIAVGEYGTIMTSDDGARWLARMSGMHNPLYDIVYGNDQFVAVSADRAVTSSDGVAWTDRDMGVGHYAAPLVLPLFTGITYENSQFVAVGRNQEGNASGLIATSQDARTWIARTTDFESLPLDALSAVAYGDNQFVAVGPGSGLGNSSILTSTNGTDWTRRNPGTNTLLYGIAYGNHQFVAVGHGGPILTSPDGIAWTKRSLGTNSYALSRVAYGNNRFVAVGDRGTAVTSADGIDWTIHNAGTNAFAPAISYGNGYFVTVSGGGGLSSADGITWTRRFALPCVFYGVGYGNGEFVAVGANETIFQSGSIARLSVVATPRAGTLTLSLEAKSGFDYVIQTSSDLNSWRDLETGSNALSGDVQLPCDSERIFYRAVRR